ncbi:hypothetical protein [Nocardioides humi]|uniref:Streptomycin 6-kinase n=1 Tax=Nocardioides humi TaxID=449461 RepID=A0ABN2BTI9_9ACTN|nr:hypothetical protein [Nocardioides humi]
MELHRADPAVLEDDPFWSAVHRRHPDLTVVLLPDEPGGPSDGVSGADPTPPERAGALVRRLAAGWRLLAPLLAQRGATDPPSARWAVRDSGEALVLEKALPRLDPDAGTDLLRDVAWRLGEEGWRLAASTRAGRPLLRATDGELDLTGEAAPALTMIELASPPLRLPDDVRREIRAALLAEVA